MENFIVIVCCLCLLFFAVVGIASMFIKKTQSHYLVDLYNADGVFFGRMQDGRLVVVSGDLNLLNLPSPQKTVSVSSTKVGFIECKTEFCRAEFSESGECSASVLFSGTDKVLLRCQNLSNDQDSFLAIADVIKLNKFKRKNPRKIRVFTKGEMKIREIVISVPLVDG